MPRLAEKVTDIQKDELRFLMTEETALLREVAKKDLWTFATEVLWPDIWRNHYDEDFHQPICSWVDSADPRARKLLLMPRGHRKTYLVTVAHAVWLIVNDPNIRIILVSALDDTAQLFTAIIKEQFLSNENFHRVFPEFKVANEKTFGRTYDFTHPMRDTILIDPTFRAFYLGAATAGRRCDILIFDDPIEKKHVTTPEQADKALSNFNDLIPVVDKTNPRHNKVFVIGTRWGFNDIYGALLGEDRGDDQTVEATTGVVFDAVVRHCFETEGKPDFEEGEVILPGVWSRELLLEELRMYRNDPKRGEEDWWRQYMNICQSPGGAKFESEWFDTWMPSLPGGIVFSFIALDSASKDEQILMRGDYTVALVGHFDAFGHLYLTDGFRGDFLKGAEIIQQLLSLQQRCSGTHGLQVSNFLKEKVGEDTFFGWVRAEFNRARMPLTVFPLPVRGQGKKYVRIIEAVQHPAMARQIHFIEGFPKDLHYALVNEAIHLGQWSHDDAIDCLSLPFHPKVRVSPLPHTQQEWKTPMSARLRQLSTGQHTPGALLSTTGPPVNPVTEAAPQWSTKSPNSIAADGSTREDPFIAIRTSKDHEQRFMRDTIADSGKSFKITK